jgi:hypothetical protein
MTDKDLFATAARCVTADAAAKTAIDKAKAPVSWYAPGEKPIWKRLGVKTIPAAPDTIALFLGEADDEPDSVEPVIAYLIETREDQHGAIEAYVHVVGISGDIDDFDAISVAGAIVRGMRCENGRMQTTDEFKAARKLARK